MSCELVEYEDALLPMLNTMLVSRWDYELDFVVTDTGKRPRANWLSMILSTDFGG